jgi:GNAT superfamily N-acetyltransferase
VGFVHWESDFINALHVRSSHAGQGMGRRLMDHAEDETDTFNTRSQTFYAGRGYKEVDRYPDKEWNIDLNKILLVKAVNAVTLRPYSPEDEPCLVDTWFESWLSVGLEFPLVTRADLASRLPRDLAERWDVDIAQTDGTVVGFLAVAVQERRLDQLFIAPSAQGRGIGKLLFEAAKQKMPDGFWLSTQPGNKTARAFYERAGMRLNRAESTSTIERVIYEFPGTS